MKSGDVFAGEKWTIPAPAILSITVNETPDDAAPTIALTPAEICESVVCCAISVLVSPESPRMCSIFSPSTPPAALISATAKSTPANSGGPRNARLPVSGNNEPIFRGPDAVPPPPQPARTKPATAVATTMAALLNFCMFSPLVSSFIKGI